MEVWSSTEMGAPGASHLGTGDHGPKTDRSRPRSVPVNASAVSDALRSEWQVDFGRRAGRVRYSTSVNQG